MGFLSTLLVGVDLRAGICVRDGDGVFLCPSLCGSYNVCIFAYGQTGTGESYYRDMSFITEYIIMKIRFD